MTELLEEQHKRWSSLEVAFWTVAQKFDKGPVAVLQARLNNIQGSRIKLSYRRLKEKDMKVNEALKITDSFTRTSKMPGLSYSLPAWACKTGQKLAKIEGTPCYGCYAMKGNYTRYPAIKAAQYRRLEAIKHPDWVAAMVAVIKRQKWFRWHDAGDVQRPEHMQKILEVCRLTPDTKHWLPTQERQYLPDPEQVPDNLVIRLSRSKLDGPVPAAWSHDSGVTTGEARTCPAPDQGGKCGSCQTVLEQRY